MYCKYCGKEIDENSRYCSYCGKRVNLNSPKNSFLPKLFSPKDKWSLIIYGFWFAVNLSLLLLGGTNPHSKEALFPGGFREIKVQDYDTGYSDDLPGYHTEYKYVKWVFDYSCYDYTDFLFYAVVIPFVLFLLFVTCKTIFQLVAKSIFRPKRS